MEKGPNLVKHHPKIKLEVLSKRGVYALLVFNYLTLIFAITFGIFEYGLRIKTDVERGIAVVSPEEDGLMTFTAEISNMTSYNRFLMIYLNISNPSIGANESISRYSNLTYIVEAKSEGMEDWLLLVEPSNFSFTCESGFLWCQSAVLDFLTSIEYSNYRAAVNGFNVSWQTEVEFKFTLHSRRFTEVEMSVNVVLLLTTIIGLSYWFFRLKRHPEKLLPEQFWTSFLLLSIFLHQDPVFLLQVQSSTVVGAALTGQILNVVSFAFLFVFVLLVVDGLSYPSGTVYRWPFYLFKIIFGVLWGVSTLLATVLVQLPWFVDNFGSGLVFAAIVTILGGLVWFFWFIRLLYRTQQRLRKSNFLSTRYRQLAFRFLLLLSILTILYLFFAIGFALYQGARNDNYSMLIAQQYTSLSTLILVTVFGYSVNFIYLPPKASFGLTKVQERNSVARSFVAGLGVFREEKEERYRLLQEEGADSLFCLETAAWMFEFAWQVYYDPPSLTTPSGAGPMDLAKLEQLGWSFYDFKHDPVHDTNCLIVRRNTEVVVAFRGTSSFDHVVLDLKSSTVPLVLPEIKRNPSASVILESLPGLKSIEPAVHTGFKEAFDGLWPRVFDCLAELRDEEGGAFRNLKFYFTGHSMGGALAILSSLLTKKIFPELSCIMYNFGAPRVGNHVFAKIYNSVIPNSFRLVNDRDLVTGIPKFLFIFKHVGLEINIDKRGNLVSDLTPVEKMFRSGKRSFRDHQMERYRAALIAIHAKNGAPDALAFQSLLNLANSFPLREPLPDGAGEKSADSDEEQDEKTRLLPEED